MAKQTPAQKETVERVMHEFKHGELERNDGRKVEDPKQAIAIALREAGSSNQESPARNRASLRRTKAKERSGRTGQAEAARGGDGATRQALYAEARKKGVPGRSKMSKAELQRALAGS